MALATRSSALVLWQPIRGDEVMHIEFLVEEPSMEAALHGLLPRLLPEAITWRILVFNGKADLRRNLPKRLKGYSRWMPEDWRIVVLVDEDRQDCRGLKQELEAAANDAGLQTKTSAGGGQFQVLNRIVIEELEAWFLGDLDALRSVVPRLPQRLPRKFADPDSVRGGTAESLERWLQQYGYFRGGYSKIAAARQIAPHLAPARNRSRSFQVFLEGLRALTE